MAYSAKVIEIMIASPGDVIKEREIVREVIAGWNVVNSREKEAVLMPLGWDTHSSPELSGRPQQIINDRILVHADLLVGIFWTRVGSATGKAISGSVEEIDEHLKKNKPVMLYFSAQPVAIDSVDHAQYENLKTFKSWAATKGLVEEFDSPDEFQNKFQFHLPITLRDNPYLKGLISNKITTPTNIKSNIVALSEDEREILKAAAADQGVIMVLDYIGGTTIQAGRQVFGEPDNRRSIARWEGVVDSLKRRDFIRDKSGKGEYFELTDSGYQVLEEHT